MRGDFNFGFAARPELQYSLDYDQKLPVSAQAGMAQADENANDRWKRWVDGAIQVVATRQEEFTVDDVLGYLESLPYPPRTHNMSAIGPRMRRVARELGYMQATDRKVRSKTEHKHGNLRTVWRSKLFGRLK